MPPFIVAGLVVLIDQATKAIAAAKLSPEISFPAVGNLVSFTLVENTGAGFGLFKNQILILVLISAAAIFFTVFYMLKKRPGYYLPFALILGGAAGNLIDRLRFGHVIDFIDLHWWPVFNIADSCITVGSVILFFVILRGKGVSRTV
jgi:signal peptidase II